MTRADNNQSTKGSKMAKRAKKADASVPSETICSVKGFDKDLKCRGFQYEIGATYEHGGPVVRCTSGGFHACDAEFHPLEVFGYYPPASSRYADVIQGGALSRDGDAKVASARITIEAEIQLPDLIQRAVKWVFDRAKWVDGPVATQPNEAATASGYQGAATASGDQGAATASGEFSVAIATAAYGRARAVEGAAIVLVNRANGGSIRHIRCAVAGREVKPDTWYCLGDDGEFVEVEE